MSSSLSAVSVGSDAISLLWTSPTADVTTRHLTQILRANCLCEACRHACTNQRLVDVASVPDDLRVVSAEVMYSGKLLQINWSPEHTSTYPSDWLYQHSHLKTEQRPVGSTISLWNGASLARDNMIPTVFYNDIMGDDASLLHALELFKIFGFFIIKQAPTRLGVLEDVCRRIGYMKTTHYGRTFEVKAKRKPESFAYTPERLGFHTDLPYREDSPGVQLLHCVENSATGGESTLMDGFQAATALKTTAPEAYDLLTRWPVTFTWQKEEDVFFSSTKPIIALEPAVPGQPEMLSGLSFDNRNMSLSFAYSDADEATGKDLLRAYRLLSAFINDPNNLLKFKAEPGDILFFNNRRVLHGREAFDPRTGDRLLEGCYMDLDVVSSRRRALAKKLTGFIDARYTTPEVLERLKEETQRKHVVEGPE